jgi:NADPH:quinone reductase-like Zn-dependent oxidoreductase
LFCSLKTIDVEYPHPQKDQVIVKLHTAALNHRDLFARQKLYPGATGGVPILADGAGVVVKAGSQELEKKWVGKRVMLTPARG